MITLELSGPFNKAGLLDFWKNGKVHSLYYFNRDPYRPIEVRPGSWRKAESYPSYIVFNTKEMQYYYGTYGEIKAQLTLEELDGPNG